MISSAVPSRVPHGKHLDSNYLMGNGLYVCVSEIPGVTNGDDAGNRSGAHGILAGALLYTCRV